MVTARDGRGVGTLFDPEPAREGQRRFVVVDDATVAPRRRLGAFPRRHECFALLTLLVFPPLFIFGRFFFDKAERREIPDDAPLSS